MNETVVRSALHRAAEDIEPYPVLGLAMRQARRRRVMRLLAAPTVIVTLAVFAVAGWIAVSGEPVDRPADPAEQLTGLPNRLHDPRSGIPTVSDQPPGPMAVAYTGINYGALSDSLYVVLSGPAGYRVTDRWDRDEVYPGEEVLLSPAGDRLASYEWQDETIAVLDLRTGRRRLMPKPAGKAIEPLAWAPDNRTIAVAVNPDARADYTQIWRELGLLDVESGRYRRIAQPTGMYSPGFAVAFSPDGRRLAYQSDDRVHVIDVDGNELVNILVPPNSQLAGKGAFTPDGAAVAISVTEGCCTHRFAFHDVATGSELLERRSAAVPDTSALRLLGWSPQGTAVAVAFRSDPNFEPLSMANRTRYEAILRAEVVTIGPGTTPARVLVNASTDVLAIDLAEQAIATGRIEAPPPAPSGLEPPFLFFWEDLGLIPIYLIPLGIPVGAVLLIVWLYRVRRRVRGRSPTASATDRPDR